MVAYVFLNHTFFLFVSFVMDFPTTLIEEWDHMFGLHPDRFSYGLVHHGHTDDETYAVFVDYLETRGYMCKENKMFNLGDAIVWAYYIVKYEKHIEISTSQ